MPGPVVPDSWHFFYSESNAENTGRKSDRNAKKKEKDISIFRGCFCV